MLAAWVGACTMTTLLARLYLRAFIYKHLVNKTTLVFCIYTSKLNAYMFFHITTPQPQNSDGQTVVISFYNDGESVHVYVAVYRRRGQKLYQNLTPFYDIVSLLVIRMFFI
jgi:hypothetical protein